MVVYNTCVLSLWSQKQHLRCKMKQQGLLIDFLMVTEIRELVRNLDERDSKSFTNYMTCPRWICLQAIVDIICTSKARTWEIQDGAKQERTMEIKKKVRRRVERSSLPFLSSIVGGGQRDLRKLMNALQIPVCTHAGRHRNCRYHRRWTWAIDSDKLGTMLGS